MESGNIPGPHSRFVQRLRVLRFWLRLTGRRKFALPAALTCNMKGHNMQQAEHTNIIKMSSRIELLWKRREAAAKELERADALALGENLDDDADGDEIEAACDAAYNAVEDIGDQILATKITSRTDAAIKALVLKGHGCVEDLGYYRPEAILEFFDELQIVADDDDNDGGFGRRLALDREKQLAARTAYEEKIARATELRDAAIAAVQAKGDWKQGRVGDQRVRVMGADHGNLSIMYTTPFSKLPFGPPAIPDHWSDTEKHQAALLTQNSAYKFSMDLIDIWKREADGRTAKVFSMHWNGDGDPFVVSFRRGDWEHELIGA
jgi:hypothetical protein